MQSKPLGDSGIVVTELGFGTLGLAPMQANVPVEEGATLIRYAQ